MMAGRPAPSSDKKPQQPSQARVPEPAKVSNPPPIAAAQFYHDD